VVVLGDFNARIGKRDSEDDVLQEVRGLTELVLPMKLVSSSLSCVLLKIGLRRSKLPRYWVHPVTEQTHRIDFVMMRRDQRQL